MKKTTQEIVVMFWEDEQPVGILHQNGKREFYRAERMTKDEVVELLEVGKEPTR